MGEQDNAGFPLTYCLLSTATAIDHGKRMKSLSAWAKCLRDKYGINPMFTHVDKDMAEIGCSKEVWKNKISLCWWHLRRAVRTRLVKAKLATTPYNVKRACEEFDFIDVEFIPPGTKVDVEDYEGGLPDDEEVPTLIDARAATTAMATSSAPPMFPPPTSLSSAPQTSGVSTTAGAQLKSPRRRHQFPSYQDSTSESGVTTAERRQ